MPLTKAEEIELRLLEQSLGEQSPSRLSGAEQRELQLLEQSLRPQGTGPGGGQFAAPAQSAMPTMQPLASQQSPMQKAMEAAVGLPPVVTPNIRGTTATEMGATMGGELLGRKVGAMAGAPLGPVGVGVGTMLGGGIGSAAALLTKRLAADEQVDIGDLALEFGLSLAPEAVRHGARKVGQGIQFLASRTKVGRQSATNLLGSEQFLKGIPKRALRPPTQEQADFLWDAMRKSGFQIDSLAFKGIKEFSEKEISILKRELNKIGSGPHDAFPRIGESAARTFDRLHKSKIKVGPGLDIGALSHIRSTLTERLLDMTKNSTRSTLEKFVNWFSDRMDDGRVYLQGRLHDGMTGRDLLHAARSTSNRIFDYEAVSVLLNDHVIKKSPQLKHATLDLRSLDRLLGSDITKLSKLEQRALRVLKNNKTLASEVKHMLSIIDKIDIDLKSIDDLSGVINATTRLLGAGPLARQRVMRIALNKKKPLNMTDLMAVGLVPIRSAIRPGPRENERLTASPL